MAGRSLGNLADTVQAPMQQVKGFLGGFPSCWRFLRIFTSRFSAALIKFRHVNQPALIPRYWLAWRR
jgi:hypothetical protein